MTMCKVHTQQPLRRDGTCPMCDHAIGARVPEWLGKAGHDLRGTLTLKPDPATPEEIERARREYAIGSDDNIEIDDNAGASRTDNGVWVAAWVWLQGDDDDPD